MNWKKLDKESLEELKNIQANGLDGYILVINYHMHDAPYDAISFFKVGYKKGLWCGRSIGVNTNGIRNALDDEALLDNYFFYCVIGKPKKEDYLAAVNENDRGSARHVFETYFYPDKK